MMSRFKTLLWLIFFSLVLVSCGSEDISPKVVNKKIEEKEVPLEGNNDLTMKIEGYSYNLDKVLNNSLPAIDDLSSCPIWHNNVSAKESNFKLYEFIENEAETENPLPIYIALCDIDSNIGKYVLILAKYKNSEDITTAVKVSFKDFDGFLYLGIPTSLKLENNNAPKDFNLYNGIVSTDDCGITSPELMDTDCPSGSSVYYKIGSYLIILSQRFEKEYSNTVYPEAEFREMYP